MHSLYLLYHASKEPRNTSGLDSPSCTSPYVKKLVFFLSGYFRENIIKNDHPSELNDSTSINGCMMELKNFPKNFQEKKK